VPAGCEVEAPVEELSPEEPDVHVPAASAVAVVGESDVELEDVDDESEVVELPD
jgi:hypothetical protein